MSSGGKVTGTRMTVEEPPRDSSVEGLIQQLVQGNKREIRRSAAKELGQVGPDAAPAIPALLRSAVNVDATVRELALDALNAIDPAWPENTEAQRAFPDLVAALKSWSSAVSKAAFRLLSIIGQPAVPDLVNVLSDEEDTIDKVYVMRLLAKIGPGAASAVPGLTRALGSQFLQSRIAAADALSTMGPAAKVAVPALVASLTDSFADGRQAMAACLACLGAAAEPAMPALLPLLADRKAGVRRAAADALEQIGPSTAPALIEIVQMRDMQRLRVCFESMIKVSQWHTRPEPGVWVTDLERILNNLTWTAYEIMEERVSLEAAQVAALQVLGKFGPAVSAAVPAVTQSLADPNSYIKLAAIETLGQIGPEANSAIPDLVQFLVHRDEAFREAAIEALKNIDHDWASNPLIASTIADFAKQLGEAGNPKEIAANAVTVIGAAAVPALIDVLASRDRVARQNAAKALGRIGVEAKAAIPALTRVLEDDHPWVQNEAAKALEKIGDQASQVT